MKIKLFLSFIFFVITTFYCLSINLSHSFSYEGNKYSDGDLISISGYIKQRGSSPFINYVLEDEKGNSFTIDFIKPIILNSSIKKVTVKGVLKFQVLVTVRHNKKVIIKHIIVEEFKNID